MIILNYRHVTACHFRAEYQHAVLPRASDYNRIQRGARCLLALQTSLYDLGLAMLIDRLRRCYWVQGRLSSSDIQFADARIPW